MKVYLVCAALFAAACSTPTESFDAGTDVPGDGGSLDVGLQDIGPVDSGVRDTGTDGAGEGDAALDAGADAGADAGSDAGPLSPCECEAGVADGCCPLSAAHGVADPDCQPVDCEEPRIMEPLSLWTPEGGGYSPSTATLAPRCSDLAVVFARFNNAPSRTLFFQTRDALGETVVPLNEASTTQQFRFNGALAFSPTDASLLYASHVLTGPARAVPVDAAGTPGRAETINTACNGFAEAIATFDVGDGTIVAQTGKGCAAGSYSSVFVHLGYDGLPTGRRRVFSPMGSRNSTSFAYDASTESVWVVYQSSAQIRVVALDVETFELGEPIVLAGIASTRQVEALSVASSGGRLLVTYGEVRPRGGDLGASHFRYGLYQDGRYREVSEDAPGPEDKRMLQRRLIAHPGGFTQATTWVDLPRTGSGPSMTNPEVWITRFSTSGELLSAARMDSANAGYPDLAYIDGQVAISWVRDRLSEPMLSYITCE